jgi:hypothetical protein
MCGEVVEVVFFGLNFWSDKYNIGIDSVRKSVL